jgi:WD40 repeat protein
MRSVRSIAACAALLLGAAPAAHLEAQRAISTDTVAWGLPLEAARHARFTATSGTWMSVDVSNDGSRIVFDLLGDLYTLPIGGGAATRITSGIAHDMQPRFSPDGRRVVFVSDRSGDDNVWLANADGTGLHQLTHGREATYFSPEWTPDGQYIAVSRAGATGGAEKIWLYHTAGGRGLELGGGSPAAWKKSLKNLLLYLNKT